MAIRILLVEDNEMNRDMLSRRLERRGYEVRCAVDGEQGVALAIDDPPDVVLMDLSLPSVDGWEATRRLRAHTRTSEVPVLALSAHTLTSHREAAIEAGCDDFEAKPVDFARLIVKIEKLVERRSTT